MTDGEKILDAMRSGEWLRTQWIARVAFDLGAAPWQPALGTRTTKVLRELVSEGRVERRASTEQRSGDVHGVPVAFEIPRVEWRLVR